MHNQAQWCRVFTVEKIVFDSIDSPLEAQHVVRRMFFDLSPVRLFSGKEILQFFLVRRLGVPLFCTGLPRCHFAPSSDHRATT